MTAGAYAFLSLLAVAGWVGVGYAARRTWERTAGKRDERSS